MKMSTNVWRGAGSVRLLWRTGFVFLQDEAQVSPLHCPHSSHHQWDAGERHRGWRAGLRFPHHGGVHELHQRTLAAGPLPPPRASERSPPLDGTRKPRDRTRWPINIHEFVQAFQPLDSCRPIRRVVHLDWPINQLAGVFSRILGTGCLHYRVRNAFKLCSTQIFRSTKVSSGQVRYDQLTAVRSV